MASRRRTTTSRPRRCQIERLEDRCVLSADPIINEFLASNDGVIADQDGDFSDYIELYNRGDEPVNLGGWFLTDDQDDLTKWQLPAVDLAVGQYLVVFASGKDRAIAGSELHTNFAINVDGEYLGLILADGVTPASEFFPVFPPQHEDVSYGVSTGNTTTQLVDVGASAKALIPTSGNLGTTWTAAAFVDSSWQSGTAAAGFSEDVTPPPSTTVLQIDFNDRASSGTTQSGFSSFVLNTGSETQFGSTTRTFGSIGVTLTDVSGIGIEDRVRATPTNAGAFTESLLLRDFVFSKVNTGTSGMDVVIDGLVPQQIYTLTGWSFDTGTTGLHTSNWTANNVVAAAEYTFDGSVHPLSNDTYKFGVVVAADGAGKITLEGRRDASTTGFAVFLNALKLVTGDTLSPPASVDDVLRVDFNSRTGGEPTTFNTEPGYSTMSLDENGASFGSATITLSTYNGGSFDDRDRLVPPDSGAFTLDQVYDDFIYTTGPASSGMEILVSGLAPNASYDVVLRSYDGTVTNTRSAIWTEVSSGTAVTLANPYSWSGTPAPASNDAYAIRATVTSSPSGTLILRGEQTTAERSVLVNSLELTRASFDPIIGLDLQSAMLSQNSSAYIRVPFSVANLAAVDNLLLDMRYDSGFVAYLNGTEVARRNAPTAPGVPPAFDSASTLERSDAEALSTETIEISQFKNLLTAGGGNVLAIHGLNSSAANADFLIAPQLRAEELTSGALRYFTTPTPGAANGSGVIDFVSAVDLSQDHGFYTTPFQLTLQTPTADATIYYTYDGSAPSPTNAAAQFYTSPITIDRTTMFRAAAFKPGFAASAIETQTYIFLEDVLAQTIDPNNPANNPFGLAYPAIWQANAPADFNMDPQIVAQWDDNNPSNTDHGIREALLSLPTMSIVMDQDDMWDPTTGIYNHATSVGDAWRRPGSIEYIDPATGENFQYNVGIQMHGGASRDNVRTKKHSFRLIFNPEFGGPGRLEFPLFDNTDFADINTVVLRASFTDSFSTRTQTNRYTPIIATYMRDMWMRDSQLAMGHYSASSTYVHLYVNGLYWGLYNPTERPDDASLASHLGGDELDWDVIRDANELHRGNKDAWNAMFALARTITSAPDKDAIYWQLQGRSPDGTVNPSLPAYLDVENLIDYMLLHIYAGVEDWPSHNWIAGRNRVDPGAGFQFFVWDQEIALDKFFRDRTEVSDSYTPAELYSLLRSSSEFKLHFADRLQKFLFTGGELTTAENQERWNARADQIEKAIIGESARWGDARTGEVVNVPPTMTVPLMTVNEWRANIADVNGYFDQNLALALSRFTTDGLFPAIGAPVLNQFDGEVEAGFQLTLSLAAGSPGGTVIYYTLDGSDPRLPGGGIRPSAIAYSGPITLDEPTHIMARSLSGSTWSALVDSTTLISTELPGDYDGSQTVDQDDYNLWRTHFGATSGVGLQADGNHDGIVDAADYIVWRKNLGRSSIGYSFNTIGQTYTQNFNFFQGAEPTLPAHFTFTADSGIDIFRGVFNSTINSASSFTGIMAATSDGLNHSLAWRENTGSAALADGRALFALTNNTSQPITAFNYSYDVEAWVNGRRDNQVRFKYDVYADNAAAQAAAGRDAFATDIAATLNPNHTPIAANEDEFVLDGKAAANRVTVSGTVDLTTLLIDTATPGLGAFGALQPGQTAYFRWQISNANLTSGNRSALAIDNFSLTPLAVGAGQGAGLDSEFSTPATAPTALPPDDTRSLVIESFAYKPTFIARRVSPRALPAMATAPPFEKLLLLVVSNDARSFTGDTSGSRRAEASTFNCAPSMEVTRFAGREALETAFSQFG
jgi:hypothetical protein